MEITTSSDGGAYENEDEEEGARRNEIELPGFK